MSAFKCSLCEKTFSRQDALKRHVNITHCEDKAKKMYACEVCDLKSAYKSCINAHMKKIHRVDVSCKQPTISSQSTSTAVVSAMPSSSSAGPSTSRNMATCMDCDICVPQEKMSAHLRSAAHREKAITKKIDDGIEMVQTAFKNRIATYRIKHEDAADLSSTSIESFFLQIKEKTLRLIQTILDEHISLKIYFELFGWYIIPTKEGEEGNDIRQEIKSFNSEYKIVTISTDLEELYTYFCDILKKKSEDFEVRLFLFYKI